MHNREAEVLRLTKEWISTSDALMVETARKEVNEGHDRDARLVSSRKDH